MNQAPRRTRWPGFLAIVVSAALFAAATVLVKSLTRRGLPPTTVAFGRFFVGAVVLGAYFLVRRVVPSPDRWPWVLARALGNLAAVLMFYKAIELTTVTNANVLNMTYPLFVAVIAPWAMGERTGPRQWLALALGAVGVWLVIRPEFGSLNLGDLYGLICGVLSAFSVLVLRKARTYDDATTIVFWVMLIGAIVLVPSVRHLVGLAGSDWLQWVGAAICGVGGQVLITFGYRDVTALDGSIASSSRIFFAAVLGVSVFGDPLTTAIVAGALMILAAIALVSTRGDRELTLAGTPPPGLQ